MTKSSPAVSPRSEILVAAPRHRPYVDGDALDYEAPFVWTVAGVFSEDECAELVARIEAIGPEAAPITTARGFVMNEKVRNNTRSMFDDVDLAARFYARVQAFVPERMNGAMRPCGANERWRCYRYDPGQYFAPHYDGCFRRSSTEESLLTAIVYLNEDCRGGETVFPQWELEVRPRRGSLLLFQHRLLHASVAVTGGRKYVARTDVMYRRDAA
jgi:predicted 2-oxoglutarate/Fe(II)-dependent dioxygenase YbiX